MKSHASAISFAIASTLFLVRMPDADLMLCAPALAPDPKTRIILNCAGRTRSIIDAQSLINASLSNPDGDQAQSPASFPVGCR